MQQRPNTREIEDAKNSVFHNYLNCPDMIRENASYFVNIMVLYAKNFSSYAENFVIDNNMLGSFAREMALYDHMMKLKDIEENLPHSMLAKYISNFSACENGQKQAGPTEIQLHNSVKNLFFIYAGI
jgi:hypothetical protein